MKKQNFDLKEIELYYDVESVLLGNDYVWPIIRFRVNEALRKKEGLVSRTFKLDIKKIAKLLKFFFYGLQNIFRIGKYEYWIFSSSDRRKKIDGKYIDRVIEPLATGVEKALVIENPYPLGNHYDKRLLNGYDIMGQTVLFVMTKIIGFFNKTRLTIDNEELVSRILEENDIEMNVQEVLKMYLSQYRLMKCLLNFGTPKVVFFVYSASSMGYIKALKEKNVPVIELQHGVINASHYAYNVYKNFGTAMYPDYLFTYGEKELTIFDRKNYFIDTKNVFPVGYAFLERFNVSPEHKAVKDRRDAGFKYVIAFSLQDPFEKYVFDFLEKLASLVPSLLILAIPRDADRTYADFPLRRNLVIERTKNVYECLEIADFHSTINSTCAIESLYYGVPNILYDFNGWAFGYYERLLNDSGHTVFAKSAEEFVEALLHHRFYQRDKIIEISSHFFKKGFEDNVKKILEEKILTKRNE